MAPLSAALANGDDTLSITADCYSTAGTDAAIAAALLAYYTSSQVDTLLRDYHTGTAQDAETTSAITAALLDGPGPGRLYNQPNHLGAGGVPLSRDQDTATASSIAAAAQLLSITQVDGLLAGKLGVAEAIAVRFPDDGRADKVVAIGEQILAPTDVLLSNWFAPAAAAAWSWPRTPRAQ